MRIAVDASSLSKPSGGIGRYLEQVLRAVQKVEPTQHEWILYGRGALLDLPWESDRVQVRDDHLPTHTGRILSLFSTMPCWLRQDQPDVFWGPAHRMPYGIPARTASVLTVHDMVWRHAPQTMRRVTRTLDSRMMPRALKRVDRIIAVSAATRDDLCSEFPDTRAKTTVIHEAAAGLPPALGIGSVQELGVRGPYLLFVGTLEPRKNLVRLLQSFARMVALEQPHAQLVVAGTSGWGKQTLQTEVERLALEPHVLSLGWVSDTQLATLYKYARCLAMPSLYEGFGLPLLEAMTQGTPVMTSNTSSMPEVLGDAGILVDPLDVAAMAQALSRLFGDDELHQHLSSAGRQRATDFCWENAAQSTLQEFRKAVHAHASR